MIELFYFGIILLSVGLLGLALFGAYKLGERNGFRTYYNELTNREDEIE